MVNSIDSAENDLPSPERTYYDETVRIPGVGDPPNRCRGYMPVGFCEDGHVALGRSSCDTRYCPDHWGGWNRRGTETSVARLAAFRESAEGWGKRLLHVVASPDVDRVSTDRFWKLMSEAQDVVREAGVRGGLEVAHPYRSSQEGDMRFETVVEQGEWERDWGRWSFFRDFAGGDWEQWESLIEPGPHYHFIGACRDFDPEAIPDGWVVKNVRSFSRFEKRDLEAYQDMARAVYYLRTHGAVQQGRHTVRWFGALHPNTFDPAEELGATEWHFIQERAGEVVGESPAKPEDGEKEEERCEVDGCEAVIHPIEELWTYTANAEWMRSVPPKRRHRLRAVTLWVFEESVKPPPEVRASEAKVREWLLEIGGLYFNTSRQSNLGTFGEL
jgi:hypothetical protein